MNRKQLTPAPWTPHHHMKDCVTFIGKDGEENLFINNADGYFACQSEQDANLISAAHEMLNALEGMEHLYAEYMALRPEHGATLDNCMEKMSNARAAVRKARGK